ncbi:RNA-metabolising metallo-beta-lactamase [compost metagenome]
MIQASEGAEGFVQLDLDGEACEIRAKVMTLSGYSGHADQAGLLVFATGIQHAPTKIVLVHGERASKNMLASVLKQAFARGTSSTRISVPG